MRSALSRPIIKNFMSLMKAGAFICQVSVMQLSSSWAGSRLPKGISESRRINQQLFLVSWLKGYRAGPTTRRRLKKPSPLITKMRIRGRFQRRGSNIQAASHTEGKEAVRTKWQRKEPKQFHNFLLRSTEEILSFECLCLEGQSSKIPT
jgi:hypothetical protein